MRRAPGVLCLHDAMWKRSHAVAAGSSETRGAAFQVARRISILLLTCGTHDAQAGMGNPDVMVDPEGAAALSTRDRRASSRSGVSSPERATGLRGG
jgi:hypothetical protein